MKKIREERKTKQNKTTKVSYLYSSTGKFYQNRSKKREINQKQKLNCTDDMTLL